MKALFREYFNSDSATQKSIHVALSLLEYSRNKAFISDSATQPIWICSVVWAD